MVPFLVHERGASRDELCRARGRFAIRWSVTEGAPESTSEHGSLEEALADWYLFPRRGESFVARKPKGFDAARRHVRGATT